MEEEKESRIKIRQYMYYFIIGIISFVALVFLPMVGSEVGLGWNIPTTTVGWIVWVAVKLIVAVINVLIFYSFMQQAKLNVKDNEYYKKAREILVKVKIKNVLPRSPKKWNAQEYGKKGTIIFVTTALATVALTQALLTFDYMSMLTYLFTIVMGIIFGILQMKKAEEYWIDEYYRYAVMVKENAEEEKKRLEEEEKKKAEEAEKAKQEEAKEQERQNALKIEAILDKKEEEHVDNTNTQENTELLKIEAISEENKENTAC